MKKYVDTLLNLTTVLTLAAVIYSSVIFVNYIRGLKADPSPPENIKVSLQAFDGTYWHEVVELNTASITIGDVKKRREGKYRLVVKAPGQLAVITNLFPKRR